jgi:hypothetical protein
MASPAGSIRFAVSLALLIAPSSVLGLKAPARLRPQTRRQQGVQSRGACIAWQAAPRNGSAALANTLRRQQRNRLLQEWNAVYIQDVEGKSSSAAPAGATGRTSRPGRGNGFAFNKE